MDSIIIPENTNISFEILYNSLSDNKPRFIRTAIDFKSNSESGKKILFFVLEELCNIYKVPIKLAS